jgi:hypothetical protein
VKPVSQLPNLFKGPQKTSSAQRLYEIFLSRLSTSRRSDRILSACREIRRYAKLTGKPHTGAFTYFWEMEAHAQRTDYDAVWRSLRAEEQFRRGKRLRLASHRWSRREHGDLIFRYAPLLYLTGRYRLGCRLMETALEMVSHQKGWWFECLWHVYKPLKSPSSTYDVTLAHFYTALGRDLSDWELWDRFLDGFDPKLFRSSGISKEALRQHPRLMKPFFEWIVAERRKRLFTGTADGERDLLESPSKVRRRQSARKEMLLRFDERSRQDLFEQRFEALFPELTKLPQPASFEQLLRSRNRK